MSAWKRYGLKWVNPRCPGASLKWITDEAGNIVVIQARSKDEAARRGAARYRGTGVLIGATAQQCLQNIRPGVTTVAGLTYTLLLSDESNIVLCTNAAAVAVTIPDDATAATTVGYISHIHQAGTGQVTLVGGAGVTLNYATSLSTRVQNAALSVFKVAANEWNVVGDQA